MRSLNALWARFVTIRFFAIYNLLAIVIGGSLAAIFMQPDTMAGPVRVSTYILFGTSSLMLARKYIKMVRQDPDGMANLFVVASCYWWLSFAATAFLILYLIVARELHLWPNWGESLTERVSYFFISGSAVGVFFKAVTFEFIPTEWLIDRRVPAWPLTIGARLWKSRRSSDE